VAEVVYEVGTGMPPTPANGAGRGRAQRRGRRSPQDPRELSPLFDDDVAELVTRLLSRERVRIGADEALRRLGQE